MQQTKGKQATRGQKQIHEENEATFRYYTAACFVTAGLWILLNFTLFESSTNAWISMVLSLVLQIVAVGLMLNMKKAVRNDRKQVVDAGLDLNDPQGFAEYCKDTVILCCAIQLLTFISSYFFLLLLLFPVFGSYKVWTSFLGPWIFAPAPETDAAADDKAQRRREKRVYLKR
jgi:hypothetical protein